MRLSPEVSSVLAAGWGLLVLQITTGTNPTLAGSEPHSSTTVSAEQWPCGCPIPLVPLPQGFAASLGTSAFSPCVGSIPAQSWCTADGSALEDFEMKSSAKSGVIYCSDC